MFFRRGVFRLPPYGAPGTVDGVPDEASRDHSQPTPSCSTTVEEIGKGEGQRRPAPLSHLPEPCLRSLERLAQLEKRNLQLQQENHLLQNKIMELEMQVSSLHRARNTQSLWGRLKRQYRMRRGSVRPQETIQITVTSNTSRDTTSQSWH